MIIVARLRILFIVSLLFGLPNAANADVTLPTMFSDHMVLQRNAELPVWGWADAGEEVTVRLGEAQQTTTADDSGNWSVQLPARKADGPLTLTVEAKSRIEIQDVLVGEVWVCSGQSNMWWPVKFRKMGVLNSDEEVAQADYPDIRLFTVPSATPNDSDISLSCMS